MPRTPLIRGLKLPTPGQQQSFIQVSSPHPADTHSSPFCFGTLTRHRFCALFIPLSEPGLIQPTSALNLPQALLPSAPPRRGCGLSYRKGGCLAQVPVCAPSTPSRLHLRSHAAAAAAATAVAAAFSSGTHGGQVHVGCHPVAAAERQSSAHLVRLMKGAFKRLPRGMNSLTPL